MVERQNALIRSALQRAETQVIKKSLCVSFVTVLGLVAFMRHALTSINYFTSYQALPGRQPHLLPPLVCGYYGDLDQTGQNNLARAREIVAIAIVEATAEQTLSAVTSATKSPCRRRVSMNRATSSISGAILRTKAFLDGEGQLK